MNFGAYLSRPCLRRTSSLERSSWLRAASRASRSASTSATVRVEPATFIWFSSRVISRLLDATSPARRSNCQMTSFASCCPSYMHAHSTAIATNRGPVLHP